MLTPDGESNIIYKEAQQGWTGILGWLAQTQRQLSVIFSSISRNNTRPSRASVIAAQRACEYAKQTHEDLIFTPIKKPAIVLWGDANYDLKECEGRIGWEVQVIESEHHLSAPQSYPTDKVIAWRSHRYERKLASSTEAELAAMLEIAKIAPMYSAFVKRLWGTVPPIMYITDSRPLLDWIDTGVPKSDHGCQGRLDLLRQRIQQQKALPRWVPTAAQRADKHTKLKIVNLNRGV